MSYQDCTGLKEMIVFTKDVMVLSDQKNKGVDRNRRPTNDIVDNNHYHGFREFNFLSLSFLLQLIRFVSHH